MRVFGSADHFGADRTSDRAGAAQESAARLKPMRQRTVSRVVSVKRRWRGRALPCAPPLGRESRSERDHSRRLSRSGFAGHGPFRQSQRGGFVTKAHIGQREIANQNISFPAVLLGKVPVRCAPVANFPGRRHDRQPLPAPSLTKSAVRHCNNPTLDQAWPIFPLAEG